MFRLPSRGFGLALAIAALVAASPARAEDPFDIIYFGNSFTNATCCGSSRSVPDVISDIAVAAGRPAPRNVNRSANGQSLAWHLANNTSAINTAIPAAEDWDFVVLQDFSTAPTHIGNLSQHLSNSLAMYQAVANRSADVVPVMYETWARGPGHSYYAGANPTFPGGPAQMQQELRDGYQMSTANINAVVGSEIARLAPVGDAWEESGFPLNYYAGDIYHAQNRGTLLNALVLYGTIYGDSATADIPLTGVLSSLGLSAADGLLVTAAADSVLAVEVPEPSCLVIVIGATLTMATRRLRR
ncbi:hypothetical protein Pla108_09310 [Botrimarina colliarenosi]|uniref:PEP-CTERM protein-sorting domain-containing protein n=1 Tax=Botrimarina colliarenosi TaxID=2528001 RepID=A0A5C6AKF7_9BACT|nr:hypothetical protein [Botrimarina colliarenosi]TWT99987.1 hypothetical protein Pla108_09310 [Botrimarina colliarenosi]